MKKVRKFWLLKEFESWLKKNEKRFNHKPTLIQSTSRSAKYEFTGVNKYIGLSIDSKGQFIISVIKNKSLIDIIYELDVFIQKTKSGRFYCGYCLTKYRKYYKTLSSLLIAECFNELITWSNTNFISENSLIALGNKQHWYQAKILDTKIANRKRKEVLFRKPVLISK